MRKEAAAWLRCGALVAGHRAIGPAHQQQVHEYCTHGEVGGGAHLRLPGGGDGGVSGGGRQEIGCTGVRGVKGGSTRRQRARGVQRAA